MVVCAADQKPGVRDIPRIWRKLVRCCGCLLVGEDMISKTLKKFIEDIDETDKHNEPMPTDEHTRVMSDMLFFMLEKLLIDCGVTHTGLFIGDDGLLTWSMQSDAGRRIDITLYDNLKAYSVILIDESNKSIWHEVSVDEDNEIAEILAFVTGRLKE
jgi:hypothetical protein